MIINRGTTATLTAEWRAYPGGPSTAVTGVTVTITRVGGAAVVTGAATLTPAVGFNTYAWTVAADATPGDYLITWTGTDPDSETVTASELVTVLAVVTAPLGGPYASRAQLKSRMGIPDSNTSRDIELDQRLLSAARDINAWCHRQFGRAEVATAREFRVGRSGVDTDDFWTTDGLDITPYLGGTAGTPWDVSTLTLEPFGGIVNQVPGWPYRRIASGWGDHPLVRAMAFTGASRVMVTACWGWAAVPENVATANLMLAVADDKAKDAPFGVAGFGDFAVRIRQNPMVAEKLKDYVVDGDLLVGS